MEWALAKACKEISSDCLDDDDNVRMVIDIKMKIRLNPRSKKKITIMFFEESKNNKTNSTNRAIFSKLLLSFLRRNQKKAIETYTET